MKALIAGLLLLAGCRDDVEMFPLNPGGGGGESGTGFVDAGIDLGDGSLSPTIMGRVCFLQDARRPRDCESTGADGLTVTLGSASATTLADGRFTIARPTGTGLVWHVTGTTIVPSAMALSTEALIPAVDVNIYEAMLDASDLAGFNDNGAIINRVTRAEVPLTGLFASVAQAESDSVFYDTGSLTAWALNDVTGPLGMIWVPGVTPGTAQMVLNEGTTQQTIDGIQVFAGAVTFMFTDVP